MAMLGESYQEAFSYNKSASLRDAFAGQAMNALIVRTKAGFDTDTLAKEAYMMADAMMKERAK